MPIDELPVDEILEEIPVEVFGRIRGSGRY